MQSVLGVLYPPQCISCDAPTDADFALCGACWRETPFIEGLACDLCGDPLPGEDEGTPIHCDACLTVKRPWKQGRAAMIYDGNARRLVLALKHGDRPELARAAAPWLARAAAPLICRETLIVPMPIHWSRLLRRRYNQSAELARFLAKTSGLAHIPDALQRPKRTRPHDGMDVDTRFENMRGAIRPRPKKSGSLEGRRVLLVDDVMTSGASFDAATRACLAAGADHVNVLALARVTRGA
ncbi:Predicted amidophosphoribosyltransferases [Aliiroseovarius sediminilitoris]|uniref:Predicted amidophosphoribosyltransferases n=1 Tax=Aliiroseovarius sediminilitoris TaxID=1173584 RepID=A0A1I0MRA6_9RHOB|nr:double zinc ribbon domain-containing protein [Aliiroseovarius sediminilitoris]SEV91166.1 Predicted amidophosphoribosyltransferases [Aliiroseovarius sediminilitoris]